MWNEINLKKQLHRDASFKNEKATAWRCSVKFVFLKISEKFSRKYLCWLSFLIAFGLEVWNVIKKDADFKNTYFYRTPPLATWWSFILIEIYAGKVNKCVIAPTSKNLEVNKLIKILFCFDLSRIIALFLVKEVFFMLQMPSRPLEGMLGLILRTKTLKAWLYLKNFQVEWTVISVNFQLLKHIFI